MRETILIQIDTKMFDVEVGYEMLDGVITDINTLFIVVDGIQWNMHYLIESLKEGLVEDITDILKGKADES